MNQLIKNKRQGDGNGKPLNIGSVGNVFAHAFSSPVAIIGLAFRFPGDLGDEVRFWNALKHRRDLVTQVPDDRWAVGELQHKNRSEPGRSITFSAGVLSRIDEFDAGFFGISPREAAWLDPQQRLLLELSWEAMENAGVPPAAISGTDCAVYIGISSLDYGTRGLDDLASMSSHSMTGNTLSIAANRLSYVFDLHGPSLAVDTACSSSLVALHHACRTLQTGEASTALVGGVNLLLHPYPFVGFTKASMLSADGRCKAFDASGNGYVRAEGGAVLLLKPLEQAISDGDEIQAVILATGTNADGARKTGITIPSREGQAELMRSVLAKTGLTEQDIDFVEAHGTGTMVGDPIETAAIGEVYGHGREKPLPIGSVKSNLGHMEAASGMAGLVKTILALKHRALPPQIHLETPNPNIDFTALNLHPVTEYQELEKNGLLVAGVNSFGFGGANAHVLLREPHKEDAEDRPTVPDTPPPLILSARTDVALRALAESYVALLNNKTPLDYYDIAYAAANRRNRLEKRLSVVASTSADAAEKLAVYARGGAPDGIVYEDMLPQAGGIAFVYSGNGAQWVGMGRRLLAESVDFAELLADLDRRIQSVAGFSLLAELLADAEASRLDDTMIAQPLLFAIQVAITQLLKIQGIEPIAVTGHSVGEVAAAWACGALDLDAAIQVIVARSRAQGETRGMGRMAAAGLTAEAMSAFLSELGGDLDLTIAGINSPKSLTLSGSLADLERIQAHFESKGTFFRLLDLDYAFHSRKMDPIRSVLLENLAGLQSRSADRMAFVSTVTGAALDGDQLGPEYWWRNVREPVRFSDAIATLSGLGCRVFIEIGPHAILQRYINECLSGVEIKGRVLPTLQKENNGFDRIVETALRAHLLADKTNLSIVFPQLGHHVRLPNYPWQRERYWHPHTSESLLSIERRRVHPILGWKIPEANHAWENILDPVVLPWLADHKVGGAVVFPGAAYAELALAAAHEWLGGEWLVFEEMDIVSPMVFDGEHARKLRFDLNDRDGSFQIKSRQRLSKDEWTLHAVGRILQPGINSSNARILSISSVAARVDGETHYRLAAALGLDYGPAFRGLREAILTENCLQAELEYPDNLTADDYLIHPALLDVCYQSLVDFFRDEIEAGQGVALLPVKTGRLERYHSGKIIGFRTRIIRRSARSVLADFELFDAENKHLASVSGCRFRAAPLVHKEQEKIARWRIVSWLHPHPAEGLLTKLPSMHELAEAIRRVMDESNERRRIWFKEALPLFEALVVSFAFEAFQAISQDTDLQRLAISADPYNRWLTSLLRQEGLLFEQEDRWFLAKDSNMPAAEEIWRTLEREHGDALPQLTMLGRLGRNLARLQLNESERRQFVSALWHTPAAETLYQDDPAYSGTRQAVEHFLYRLANDLPSHRRLRVLEIAAGTSEVPRTVLINLPEDRLDYVLALPEVTAERQQAEYALHHNLVIATLEGANWHLNSERKLPQAFDVVIVRHVLHQAPSPKAALNQARCWLAAGGYLIVEERHPDCSADFIAGLDADWWHEAIEGDVPLSSLVPPAVWMNLLETEGFEDVLDFSESAADGLYEGAYLVLARRSEQSATVLPKPESASWLLLADSASSKLAEHLSTRLEFLGQQVETSERLPAQSGVNIDHVVCLLGWNDTPETSVQLLASALGVVQNLVADSSKSPRLWFITRGGALVSNLSTSGASNPSQAALWGFGRVVMNEYPALDCTLIDLACDPLSADTLNRLENELLRPDGTSEVKLTNDGRYTLLLCEEVDTPVTAGTDAERFRLDFHLPGKLHNLLWLPQHERSLQEGEVEIKVQATGLNFRDVMYLMGLLPDEAVEKGFAGASLGLEFAGIINRVGARVCDFRPGDKVMGFASACFASHVVTRADAIALMPDEWSFESAATVPTVFFTVYYALRQLADLQANERVLIHGGAGGVGIAAIQLAKHLGAEVFATAGSDEKRDFVHLLGADHVFDSRSLAFADDILAVTNGEGVDVVLNSLAGEAIRRSLRVLKPFGRFLELGKRDFFENTAIGLRPFKDNISYFGIDADQLLTGRPQLAARLFREVMALFREGILTPLPCRIFPVERVVDAFRTMQQAKHIGKLVVSFADARPVIERSAALNQSLCLANNSTWIVTGGLSGFGLESARWLAAHGVGNLVLLCRRGLETPGAKEAVEQLIAKGVNVHAVACDITNAEAVVQMVEYTCKTCPPIKGVLHAAAIFDDAFLHNLDAERMGSVVAPKLLGAWNLHQATLGTPLEFFVLYSSITTAIGNPGQANYVAANAGLEGLAEMRRHMGLPAACIGWGPIGDAGYLTRNEAVRDSLEQRLGRPPLSTSKALDQLAHILTKGTSLAIANFDWNTLVRLLPSSNCSRFTVLNRSLKNTGLMNCESDFQALITGKPPEEVAAFVQQWVVQEVAQILAIAADRIDPSRSLHDMGLDSLMAVELALGLEQRFGIQLPVMMLNESPTAEKVTQRIVEKLLGRTDEQDLSTNTVDTVVRNLAKQHGESMAAEDVQQIAEGAQTLAQQGARLTA